MTHEQYWFINNSAQQTHYPPDSYYMYLLKASFAEFIVFILIIWIGFSVLKFILDFIGKFFKSSDSPRSNRQPTSLSSSRTDSTVYRPSSHYRPKIKFKSEPSDLLNEYDIKDLVDALTGAQLIPDLGLYQCTRCKVFYQSHSYEVIRSENAGRCVSCLNTTIESVSGKREQRGRNADVSIITLSNYRQHVGRVITFEGYVYDVLTSRRGSDYAVMFENKSWTKGFKMVIFRGDVYKIGGYAFLSSLIGKTIRIRGLLVKHSRFGYEIIISDPGMILSSK